ncbi:hypothetical protein LOTGIDRAFT_197485 [Lottia gigantea]|uniref:Solute carrier organic anion transporter family member n=1 Tax=Lottia gigantea TaxID=225164 RepID=V3ZL56_LOTGI|nr:hypothetical protein LOTGIDRAFT_197485 [Lottia gigantea]ESO83135.1 hypothetical protein LOTGIDRAFT_197485 [Lottia gigantea]
MGCFAGIYGLSGIMTSSLQIYINSQITTLEKQFGLSSTVSGLILSSNDIGYLLTTLFMSYIARRTHIPRVLALSTIFYGISGILCSVPHFLNVDSHRLSSVVGNVTVTLSSPLQNGALCVNSSLGLNATDHCALTASLATNDNTVRTVAILFLALGMCFQGFGKSPRYPFLATYVDDNVEQTKTPMFLGIISGMGILGPALGFVLGGVFSRFYVTLENTSMSTSDPRWIGAWWLGFLFFGSIGIIVGTPLLCFPKRMKTRPRHLDKLKKKKKDLLIKRTFCTDIKELMKSVLRLLTSPIYILSNMASCILLLSISGMLAYLPKYLESQYRIPTWKANVLLGTMNVFGASLGIMVGGIFTTRLKLKPLTCLKFVVITTVVSIGLSCSGFFLGCDPPNLHMGVNSELIASNNESISYMTPHNMTYMKGVCDVTACDCDDKMYFPVCGSDDLNYFSPCHAGCRNTDDLIFSNCTCIGEKNATAQPGLCGGECDTMLWVYVAFNFVAAFATTLTIMPSFIVYVRSIREKDKPLGTGLSAFLNTLLGFFPGAIVYGRMIDTTCLIWSTSCSGNGSCSLYDSVDFRVKYHLLFTLCRIACSGFYIIALVVALKKKQPFYIDYETPQVIAEKELFVDPDIRKKNILKTKGTKV